MARIKRGILGGFQGSVANVVGSSWKGIEVMKSKPLSVANPKTAGQVAQRSKFANAVAFAQLILSTIIKPLWDRFASQMSGYNDFVATNIDLFENEFASPAANLVISKGKMVATQIASVTATNGNATVEIAWTDDQGEGFKLASDEAYVVVVNATKGTVGIQSAESIRSDESISLNMPSVNATGDSLSAYLAFRRADGTIVSNTGFKAKTV